MLVIDVWSILGFLLIVQKKYRIVQWRKGKMEEEGIATDYTPTLVATLARSEGT